MFIVINNYNNWSYHWYFIKSINSLSYWKWWVKKFQKNFKHGKIFASQSNVHCKSIDIIKWSLGWTKFPLISYDNKVYAF